MESLPRSIGGIVGQYMQDQGAALALQSGPQAWDTAKQMAELVMQGVGQVDPRTAQRFPENPEGYMAPLADSLGEAMQADAGLAARLQALLEKYEQAAQEHAAATGKVYQATVSGSGAVAQGREAQVASGGGVVGREIQGPVVTGEGGIAAGGDVVIGGGDVRRRKDREEER